MTVVKPDKLRELSYKLLRGLGICEEDSRIGSEVLLSSDIRGVDSHGVARLQLYYRRLKKDLINRTPNLTRIKDLGSTVVLDADNGLGVCTAPKAMKLCIERAKEYGVATVVTRNTNHFGIAGHYALMASDANMISLIGANTTPFMAPFGGCERLIGTNPLAMGIPGGKFAIILDMATSLVPVGKLQIAIRKGEKIPLDWLVAKDGRPTDNPKDLWEGGALLPMAGPKGYGLAVMIDMLAGILAGAAIGRDIGDLLLDDRPERIGHFMMAIDIDRFMPIETFKVAVDGYIDMIKGSTPAEGVKEIFLPGEIEINKTKDRMVNGIPLNPVVAQSLLDFSRELGIAGNEDTFEDLIG